MNAFLLSRPLFATSAQKQTPNKQGRSLPKQEQHTKVARSKQIIQQTHLPLEWASQKATFSNCERKWENKLARDSNPAQVMGCNRPVNTGMLFPIQDDTDNTAKIDDLPRWSWMGCISVRRHREKLSDISAGHCGKSWTESCPPQNDLPLSCVCR